LVLVVSHGGFLLELIKALKNQLKMEIPQEFDEGNIMPNTGITVIKSIFSEEDAKQMATLICLKAFSGKHLGDGHGSSVSNGMMKMVNQKSPRNN